MLKSARYYLTLPVLSEKPTYTVSLDSSNLGNVNTDSLDKQAPKLQLKLNGYALPYDQTNNVYYLPQNMATISWDGAISCSSSEYALAFVADEFLSDKASAIAQGHTFELIAMPKSSKPSFKSTMEKAEEMISYSLKIMPTGLTMVSLTSSYEETPEYPEEDVDNYYNNSETRVYGEVTIFNANPNSEKFEIVQSDVVYHERGATSSIFPKKGYALKLLDTQGKSESKALFDLPSSSKWKLLNMYTDKSKVRDMVSIKLWKEIADWETTFDEHSCDMSYCELIIDGEYEGLYGALYPINEETLGLKENDILYKVISKDAPTESAFQYTLDNRYSIAYPVRLRYPKDIAGTDEIPEKWQPMKDYLQYAYWTPEAYYYTSQLDLRNIADFYTFIQVTSASDNQFKNTYMVSKVVDDTRKMFILPWDLNYTFGDCYIYDSSVLFTEFVEDPSIIYSDNSMQQLFDENILGFRDIVASRYAYFKESTYSPDHIIGLMKTYSDLLQQSGALDRDTKKWPESANSTNLDSIYHYIKQRNSFLNDYFESNP